MPDGSAAEVSVEEYGQLVEMGIVAGAPKPQNQAELLRQAFETKPFTDWSKVRLEDLDFVTRTTNLLRREGITTVGDLVRYRASELLNMQGWRLETIGEIQAKLTRMGTQFRPERLVEIPVNGSVMGDEDWKDTYPTPEVEAPKIETPPVAYVTQAQMCVVEVLRHHPEGLTTKKIGEKLRWEHTKATRITTHIERTLLGYARPIIERVPHHYTYRLTEFGKRAAYKVDSQPSRKREQVRE